LQAQVSVVFAILARQLILFFSQICFWPNKRSYYQRSTTKESKFNFKIFWKFSSDFF